MENLGNPDSREMNQMIKELSPLSNHQNPFYLEASSPELTNIVSGQVATDTVTESTTDFLEESRKRHEAFMKSK